MWPVWGRFVLGSLREVVEEVKPRDRVENAALRINNLHLDPPPGSQAQRDRSAQRPSTAVVSAWLKRWLASAASTARTTSAGSGGAMSSGGQAADGQDGCRGTDRSVRGGRERQRLAGRRRTPRALAFPVGREP